MELRKRYFKLWREAEYLAQINWSILEANYSGRAYHNLGHLAEMNYHWNASGIVAKDEYCFTMALVYHDVKYSPLRGDNEGRSVLFAGSALYEQAEPTEMEQIERLIMSTKHHLPIPDDSVDAALLIDLDLAVLAREPDDYDRYAEAVRKEYWMYPSFLYRKGRRKALAGFLERERLYRTGYGRQQLEAKARMNLQRELSALGE